MLSAARAADMVLIPCRLSAADLTAIGASIELARQAGVLTHAILIVARKPDRSAGFQGERAGEALFTYWLTDLGPISSALLDCAYSDTNTVSCRSVSQ